MRVTQSMYYSHIYGENNTKLSKSLFDVNRQIASGLKIQYASDDVRTFTETMRLDNELTTIGQIKKSTESGYKFSNQTDVTMNEFTDSMNRMRTLLIQSANGANDDTSMDAIAGELRGIEANLKSLANTSINGQYLFSGSLTDTKPIDENGEYHGNDGELKAFVGSHNQLKYNITGADLFLGEESKVKREVTTNVTQHLNNPSSDSKALSKSSTMKEFMGDSPDDKHYFYLRGVQHDGDSFNRRIELDDDSTIEQLMKQIGDEYGNTNDVDVVNVSLNESGQIVVEDKLSGSSKLDFHMIGATDFSNSGAARTDNIDNLSSATTNYKDASTNNKLYVKEFVLSGLDSPTGLNEPEGNIYNRAEFKKDGEKLSGSVSQVLKSSHFVTQNGAIIDTIDSSERNAYAKPDTLLSEVANTQKEILPSTSPKTYTLDGESFTLEGNDITGAAYSVSIDLKSSANGGSTFNYNGVDYTIYNVDGTAADADKFTYQQLLDVVNMVTTDTLPQSANDADSYHKAVADATKKGNTSLSYDGKIEFVDLNAANTKATIALYDSKSGTDFQDTQTAGAVMAFNANNSLTIRDPKTDFFKTINEIIESVENHTIFPDANAETKRTLGIENAIAAMDDLQDHVFRNHSIAGAQSNTMSDATERTAILEVSTMSLRSSVIDTDLAEASLELSQLTLNYQAMLSTVGKVSKLSLVNYL